VGTISPFGKRFRGGEYTLASFLFAPRCSTCPAICKSTVPDPLSEARPFDDGVGSGYLRDESPLVWSRGKECPVMGSGAPRSQLFVKLGARAPVPYGVGATASGILMVNPAGVIDVY